MPVSEGKRSAPTHPSQILPGSFVEGLRGTVLRFYAKILDVIVAVMIFLMLLTLVFAEIGRAHV